MQGPAPSPTPITVDEVVARFLDGTLPREAWTHPAHLFVCQHLLREAGPSDVLADLRARIPAHNARVGVLPYHGGYHETVTRYYVEAVAATGPTAATATLLADPRCQRDAPLRHWTAPLLGSKAARSTWVEPDLEPLPWA
jgi:hypothetical protein